LVGSGGGGIWEGRGRRDRWRLVRLARRGSRWGSGELRALVVGSRVRGRRVNVWSIAAGVVSVVVVRADLTTWNCCLLAKGT
jgi:hypothetical protein